MDVLDTYKVVSAAVEQVRAERRPVLIEAITYRFRGHSMADPESYRSKDEVAAWRERDPIPAFGRSLLGAGMLDEQELAEIDAKAMERIDDTPISENTIVGVGVGAAMTGLRPVVELMTINFALLAFDQIVNSAAHIHYMFGGQARVPLVVRMPQGAGHQLGPTHSHCLEAMFLHVPGLLVAAPSTPADAKGMLKTAIRDENPVIFIEHESLYGVRGEVPEGEDVLVPFGVARVAREGSDVTIVGISRMAQTAERAAATLSSEHGVEAEGIDPRTLRPLDLDTILDSVRRPNRR